MRVYIRYSPKNSIDVYDGTRMRKSLKNALEEASVDVVDSYSEYPDVVHFISPNDEKLAVDAPFAGALCLCSALYCENDPEARFLEELDNGTIRLKNRAKILCNSVKTVLVPSPYAANILKEAGVTTPIRILPPATNLNRFKGLDEATKGAFSHYYMVEKGREHAFVKGDYDDVEGMVALMQLAAKLPDIDFYFFGLAGGARKTSSVKYRLNIATPTNLRFCDSSSDDLYRSGLCSASFYLSLSFRHNDPIGTYEAFAAGAQVFRLGPALKGDPLADGRLSYGYEDPALLAEAINNYRSGTLNPTIIAGQKAAEIASVENIGKRLKEIYEELLKEEHHD